MTSTPVGVAGNPKLGQIRHHLSADEKTSGDGRTEGPVYGSRHGKDIRPFHSREDVDTIKPYNINHRDPESTAKLDIIPTSAGHDNRSNCESMCTEMTNSLTSQPIKIRTRK